ncbi:MAG: hypothetical protein DME23_18150, partial [Verrucomicrobia bacterium]
FRVRCGDLLSVNAAGYVASVFPAGYSMIGNPLDRGNNAVAALFPNPPPKTLLYTFDAKHQTWRNANEFEFGAWTQPDETLNIGDGAFLFAPFSFRQVFAGLATKPPAFPQIEGGLNLLSVSTEGFWYHHNQPNPTAVPPQGTIYFNNYAPHVDAPFVDQTGAGSKDRTGWRNYTPQAASPECSYRSACRCRSSPAPGRAISTRLPVRCG